MDLDAVFSEIESNATSNDSVTCVINDVLRIITVPSSDIVFGVEKDKDVNKIGFEMDRYYRENDMSEFSARIYYQNANGDKNYTMVTDLSFTEDKITFSWTVPAYALLYVGSVRFAVNFIKTEGDVIQKAFNTTIATGTCLEGMYVDEQIPEEEFEDYLTHLKNEIKAYSDEQLDAILLEKNKAKKEIKDAEDAAISNIKSEAPNIPEIKLTIDSISEIIRSNNLFDIDSDKNTSNAKIDSVGNVIDDPSTNSSVSYFISITPNLPIKSTQALNATVYCYDDDYHYLNYYGYVSKFNAFKLADNTKYIRVRYWPYDSTEWMFYQNEKDLAYEPYFMDYKVKEDALPEKVIAAADIVPEIIYRKQITINNTGNIMDFYNSMLFAYEQGNTDVYITGNQYTYTNEFIEYIRSLNKRGVPVGNNNKYFFETTSKIYCEYTGDSKSDVKDMFSPLDTMNTANSFEIHGLHITSKNTVYAFHDEMNGASEYCKHIFENCYIELDNTALGNESSYISKALGGGLGQNEEVVIKNCVFKTINPYYSDRIDKTVSYHGSMVGNTDATLVITGCYFDQTFGFDSTYESTIKPVVIFCNNSYKGTISPKPEWYEAYLWNNEKRD